MKVKREKFRGIKKLLFFLFATLFISLLGFAQNTVTGKVSSEEGEPVPGATVVVKGTTRGTITGSDGSFSINAESGDILVISFVGMKSKEVTYTGQSSLEIQLEPDVIGLEEVVAAGYGTMKKSDLTGAAVSADIEAFRESPNVNILQSLQRSVPGVSVGQVNQASEEPNIQIRGQSTLSGNSSPAYCCRRNNFYRGSVRCS